MKNQNGFTLMEMMTVLAIISILAAVSIPNFIAWRASAKLNSATRDLMSDLSLARTQAINAGNPVKVLFFAEGYTIFIDDNNNNVADAGETVLRDKASPAGISMTNTFGGKTVFAQTGAVSPSGTVTLSKSSGSVMNVIVNPVGRIRVQKV